jgi:hypothetical protein
LTVETTAPPRRRSMNSYVKAILAAAIPLIAAVGAWINTGTLNAPEVALAVTGLVTAVLVYFFRNRPSGVLSAMKFIVAALTPLVSALLQALVTGDFNRAELSTLVVGILTSIMVYLVQNTPDVGQQDARVADELSPQAASRSTRSAGVRDRSTG